MRTTTRRRPDLFHAIADPTRRRILDLVRTRERPVAEILESFRITQSAVSQHLRILREAGLVNVRRAGRQHLYRADPAPMRRLREWAARFQEAKAR
jgi:DNA-binding transcriptional ArsR family regulator